MSAVAPTADLADQDQLFGHPKGLYICFATELWERFSFYGMKYLLLLYLTKYHLFTDEMGLDVLGAYAGLVYALPVIGGMLADRYLGFRKAVVFGGILLSVGHILMAVEGHQAVSYAIGTTLDQALTLANGTVLAAGTVLTETVTIRDTAALNVFYLALALIVGGVAFLKPNISTIVGKLYSTKDPRRDPGFTIFYMGINIGSFTATILCGLLGELYGWGYGFGAAGIGMVLGLITFLWGQKYLYGHAEPNQPEELKKPFIGPINKEWGIYIISIISMALIWWVVQHENVVHTSQYVMLAVAGTLLIGYSFYKGTREELQRMLVLMVLIASTIVFWSLFEQSASSMTLYADRVLERNLLGIQINSSNLIIFFAIGAIASVCAIFYWLKTFKDTKKNGGDVSLLTFSPIITCVLPLISSVLAFAALLMAKANKKITGQEYSLEEVSLLGAARGILASTLFIIGLYLVNLAFGYQQDLADGLSPVFTFVPTASNFGALNALFIILMAVPIATLWTWLAKKNLEPSTPVKFGLGILQVGVGFGALVVGAQFPNESGKIAAIWMVVAYFLHTTGELCLSPVGLSAVTKLAMPRVVGAAMGTWFLATALSETLATRMSKWAAIDTSGGEVQDVAGALAAYTSLFEYLMWFGIGAGLLMIIISPLLKKGMHGVH